MDPLQLSNCLPAEQKGCDRLCVFPLELLYLLLVQDGVSMRESLKAQSQKTMRIWR